MMEVGDEARRRALSRGAEGAAWLAGIEGLIRDVAADWQLSIGQPLRGGTASLVLAARTSDGRDAVLKLAVPGVDPWGFLEQTSTGLLLVQLGLEERALAFLRIAEAWALA